VRRKRYARRNDQGEAARRYIGRREYRVLREMGGVYLGGRLVSQRKRGLDSEKAYRKSKADGWLAGGRFRRGALGASSSEAPGGVI
jgi:hypothetical protein